MAIENKSLAILVAVNILSLVVIAWLVGLLMGRQETRMVEATMPAPVSMAAVTEPAPAAAPGNAELPPQAATAPAAEAPPPAPKAPEPGPAAPTQPAPAVAETSAPEAPMSLGELIEQELGAPETTEAAPAPADAEPRVTTVDIVYDGDIIRMEERDASGNVMVSISNSFRDAMKLAQNDAAYLQALEELKRKPRGRVSLQTVSQREARTVKAKSKTPARSADHVNKVVVEGDKLQALESELKSLAERIDSIVAEREEAATPEPDDAAYAQASVSDFGYVEKLKIAAKERINETRMIRVKPGDSLWSLAQRAYGDGFQYPRIFQANPHLTDPDLIRVGDLLRVPL